MQQWHNKLYFGDNLDVLRQHVADESVDLIYLDPPFNSAATYNVLFAEQSGEKSAAQITAFEDTWHWGEEAERLYHDTIRGTTNRRLADLLQAFRSFLGTSDMMAYLTMMAPRLAELHRVLQPTGSIYLHCDPTASHYLKLLMDAIFGPQNFRNEIIWKRSSAHSDTKQGRQQYGRVHDLIFFYTKGENWTWNPIYTPYDQDYIDAFYKHIEPHTGRRYRLGDLTGPGGAAKGNPQYEVMGVTRYWRYSKAKMDDLIRQGRIVQTSPGAVPAYKRYLDEMPGVPLQDIWTDIGPIGAKARERLGYPTQKPESLLERIIKASSNEGDVVLDPFCGCGTTIEEAERLRRPWIGIDITHLAIALIKLRLNGTFKTDLVPFDVIGEPTDLTGARELAAQNRYQFEWWALGRIEAMPAQDKKKGADAGIDGYIYFFDDDSEKAKKIIVQVKSGRVSVSHIRDLKGVLDREKAHIGVYVTLEKPTRDMEKEAVSAGFYESEHINKQYPRIQILTIEGLLAGTQVQYPHLGSNGTFKQAERKQKESGTMQMMML